MNSNIITPQKDPYPSRMVETPQVLNRIDPVVYPTHGFEGPLTSEQCTFFDQNGYLFIPQLFSEKEVETFFNELQRLSQMPDVKNAKETILEPNSEEVRSIFYIHKTNTLLKNLSRDDRILKAVKQLLGSQVYIHQSRINYKPGFTGKDFYWHSDFETWHVEDGMPRMRALSCNITLTENNPFNGPLMLIPGSHQYYISCVGETPENHYQSSLRKQDYGVPDPQSLKAVVDAGGIVAPTGPSGSVILFDCNMMHGSNSNISPWPRSNVFFVYNSIENCLHDPFYGLTPRPEFIASREFSPLENFGNPSSENSG
jgi:ectoine hydroxylase